MSYGRNYTSTDDPRYAEDPTDPELTEREMEYEVRSWELGHLDDPSAQHVTVPPPFAPLTDDEIDARGLVHPFETPRYEHVHLALATEAEVTA